MDDEPPAEKSYPTSPAKLSKTPSWIMLGFLLGAAFVAALPPMKRATEPLRPETGLNERPTFRAESSDPGKAPAPPQISVIEAVFATWGRYAVWAPDDTTQVALWNAEQRDFTEFFEVRRFGVEYYFRSLPALTRRVMMRARPSEECPLRFTETEEQYRDWIERNGGQVPMTSARPRIAPPRSAPSELPRISPGSTATESPRFPEPMPPNASPPAVGK
jgi:hypothetical protein